MKVIGPGSSPRARGAGNCYQFKGGAIRFIPTCAGSCPETHPVHAAFAVHPHVCGERSFILARSSTNPGSSPRMRGTDQHHSAHHLQHRFIPTYAGNGLPSSMSLRQCAVHLHSCGELELSVSRSCRVTGSSPRVWGAASPPGCGGAESRFIPTGAGSSRSPSPHRLATSVHPHVRGEQWLPSMRGISRLGSSPRTRGAGSVSWSRRRRGRFIPTYAGSR